MDVQVESARTAEVVLRILEDKECTRHVHVQAMHDRVKVAEDRLVQMQSKTAYVVSNVFVPTCSRMSAGGQATNWLYACIHTKIRITSHMHTGTHVHTCVYTHKDTDINV